MPKDDKGCKVVHDMCQDDEDKEVGTQYFDIVRSNIFNLHSIRSVILAKLKQKRSNEVDRYGYKINRGSDGNLMSTRMYKALFLCANLNDLSKSISRKIELCTYNKSCIP